MNLAELSQLGTSTLTSITYELTKNRYSNAPPTVLQSDSTNISPDLQRTYDHLVMLQPYPQVKEGKLAELYDMAL